MKAATVAVMLVALVLPVAATAKPVSTVPGQIAALQKQAKAQAKQIAALQATVSQLNAALGQTSKDLTKEAAYETCHFAVLMTYDYSFIDFFLLLAGQPTQYTGQTVPDNGACAAVGLTPPSPAQDREAGQTPAQRDIRAVARLLGVLPR
jgi:soluble lytic murein transglycosylase-like protein